MSNSIYPVVFIFEQQNTNQGTEWSDMVMFATVPFERREIRTLKIRINVREVHSISIIAFLSAQQLHFVQVQLNGFLSVHLE